MAICEVCKETLQFTMGRQKYCTHCSLAKRKEREDKAKEYGLEYYYRNKAKGVMK